MKIHDSLFDKLIDFLIDIKFNAGLFAFGMYIGQGDVLIGIKTWIQQYITSDFTFGQFFLIMLVCKFLIKTIKGLRQGISENSTFNFQKEFYDFLAEAAVYGCVFISVHGIANYTIDGVRQKEFDVIPRIVMGGCMVLEFKNVLNAAGLNLSRIIDNFTEFIKKFKPDNSNGKETENP